MKYRNWETLKSIRFIEQAIGYLGIALANVVNLINPGYVVADSCLFQSEKNRKQLLESAKSNFFGLNEEEVQIEFAPFEKFRGAEGAAYFLIRRKVFKYLVAVT